MDPGYRVSPASLTKCSVWAGTWYRWLFSWSFHLLLDPGYRLSPANYTKCSVSAGTRYRWLYVLVVQGEHLLVKTGICQRVRGSDHINIKINHNLSMFVFSSNYVPFSLPFSPLFCVIVLNFSSYILWCFCSSSRLYSLDSQIVLKNIYWLKFNCDVTLFLLGCSVWSYCWRSKGEIPLSQRNFLQFPCSWRCHLGTNRGHYPARSTNHQLPWTFFFPLLNEKTKLCQ